MRCSRGGGFIGILKGVNLTIFRASCKQWSCPECSKRLRVRWRHHIAKEIQRLGFHQWSFLTITAPSYDPNVYSPLEIRDLSYQLFKTQWKPFFETCVRVPLGKVQYIRCLELQARGAVHAHCLINKHFGDLQEKDTARGATTGNHKKTYSRLVNEKVSSYGFGVMNHAINLDPTSSFNTAYYMSKYMNDEKYSLGFWLPKYARYLQMSQAFNAFNTHEDKKTKDDETVMFLGHGIGLECQIFHVYDADKKVNIGVDDLDEYGQYF